MIMDVAVAGEVGEDADARLSVGTRVQARVKYDRLFYCAEVAVAPVEGVLKLHFDDDREGWLTEVPTSWVVPGEKTVLYTIAASEQTDEAASAAEEQSVDDVIVSDGFMWVGKLDSIVSNPSQGVGTKRARLISFGRSPKVYQSGVVVDGNGVYDWTHIFDPEQALALTLALVQPTISKAPASPQRVVLIGGGGFTLPMALRQDYGDALQIDAVELHAAVIEAAHRSFGLLKGVPGLNVACADGLAYLADLPTESCAVIMVDVVSTDTEDGAPLEFPSAMFVDQGFLSQACKRPLKRGGAFGMNVVADALNLAIIAYKMKAVFGNVQILATDPNYFFYSRKDPDDETDIAPDEITELAREAGVYDVAVDLISSDVQQTEHWRSEETLIGWLGFDEFVARLATEQA